LKGWEHCYEYTEFVANDDFFDMVNFQCQLSLIRFFECVEWTNEHGEISGDRQWRLSKYTPLQKSNYHISV